MTVSTMRVTCWFLPLTCLLAAGCQQQTPSAPAKPAVPAKRAVTAEPAAPAEPAATSETAPTGETSATGEGEVTVEVRSWAEVQRTIAEHQGKVVVVDFWSTWCAPCMREFPNLVRLHRQYPDRVACMSVDVNYIGLEEEPPESFHDKVLGFVSKHGATFQNVISSDPEEEVMKALDVASVPVVLVYDRQGKLRKKFTDEDNEYGEDGFTYAQHIIPLVDELLKD